MMYFYNVGDVPLPKLEWDERYRGLPGIINIGGDCGDVLADAEPTVTDDGLVLHGVVLISSREGLVPGTYWETVQHIVYEAYESIGAECFRPGRDR